MWDGYSGLQLVSLPFSGPGDLEEIKYRSYGGGSGDLGRRSFYQVGKENVV